MVLYRVVQDRKWWARSRKCGNKTSSSIKGDKSSDYRKKNESGPWSLLPSFVNCIYADVKGSDDLRRIQNSCHNVRSCTLPYVDIGKERSRRHIR